MIDDMVWTVNIYKITDNKIDTLRVTPQSFQH